LLPNTVVPGLKRLPPPAPQLPNSVLFVWFRGLTNGPRKQTPQQGRLHPTLLEAARSASAGHCRGLYRAVMLASDTARRRQSGYTASFGHTAALSASLCLCERNRIGPSLGPGWGRREFPPPGAARLGGQGRPAPCNTPHSLGALTAAYGGAEAPV
jgi:hypothetical protein